MGDAKVKELEPLMNTLDAVMEIVKIEAPFMLPVIGPLSQAVSALAVRVAELEVRMDAHTVPSSHETDGVVIAPIDKPA